MQQYSPLQTEKRSTGFNPLAGKVAYATYYNWMQAQCLAVSIPLRGKLLMQPGQTCFWMRLNTCFNPLAGKAAYATHPLLYTQKVKIYPHCTINALLPVFWA
ncbi:MAG: hypothetical protein AAFQ52_21500, partial [Chloroflexota bacterium]